MDYKTHSQMLDAIVLAETIWMDNECSEQYKDKWQHGIYEFREMCIAIAEYTDMLWDLAKAADENIEGIAFDAEWAPAFMAEWLREVPDNWREFVSMYNIMSVSAKALQRVFDEL